MSVRLRDHTIQAGECETERVQYRLVSVRDSPESIQYRLVSVSAIVRVCAEDE